MKLFPAVLLALFAPLALAFALVVVPADEARAGSDTHHDFVTGKNLHHAAGYQGNLDLVKHLLSSHNCQDRAPGTPGHCVDVNSKSSHFRYKGGTPLHGAAIFGGAEPVRSGKWEDGAKVGYPDERASIVSVLIKEGARVNARDNNNMTPLQVSHATVRAILIAAGGHWGAACANRFVVNPAGPSPPCICKSPNVKTNLGACEVVAVCDSPAALDAAANRCDCPAPNVGADGAVAPGDCAAPSVEVCGGLTPPLFHDATAGECVSFKSCVSGAALNRGANLCECAGAAVLDQAGTGCLCESPNLGTPDACAAPSETVCAGLTPPEFFDETRVSITAGECVPFVSCPAGAALDRETNTCEFSAESCAAFHDPPLLYDSNTGECGDQIYPCHDSAIRKADNSGCECPEGAYAHGDPSGGRWIRHDAFGSFWSRFAVHTVPPPITFNQGGGVSLTTGASQFRPGRNATPTTRRFRTAPPTTPLWEMPSGTTTRLLSRIMSATMDWIRMAWPPVMVIDIICIWRRNTIPISPRLR